jgi:hypothetical protein
MTAPLFAPDSSSQGSPFDGALAVAEHPITTVCAWCGAYLSGPVLAAADGIDEYEVSHGICGPCAARVAAETGLPCDDCGAITTNESGTLTVSGARWVCGTCADRRGRDAVDGRASDAEVTLCRSK